MSTTEPQGTGSETGAQDFYGNVETRGVLFGGSMHQQTVYGDRVPRVDPLGMLRIEIHGSWSAADFINLLGRLEDGYKAAAALEELGSRASGDELSRLSADEVIQIVTAFKLGGGLRLASLQYGSPGFLAVIGAINPLKTVKDGITENREINYKRDEARRLDERKREHQGMQHREAMARERRSDEHQQQQYALEVARLQLQAEAMRLNAMQNLIGSLSGDRQTVAASQLLQMLMGSVGAIANDARIDGARMILPETESGDSGRSSEDDSGRSSEDSGWISPDENDFGTSFFDGDEIVDNSP
jgi:hypothetical protein